jgi:hypothetical protein
MAADVRAEGRWWRFWDTLNDNSQCVGVGIIAFFLAFIASWLLFECFRKRRQQLHSSPTLVQDTRRSPAELEAHGPAERLAYQSLTPDHLSANEDIKPGT